MENLPLEIAILSVVILCLAASTAVLASSVPFLFWKCFRLEARLERETAKLQQQIDTLDETLARLLEGVGVPVGKGD